MLLPPTPETAAAFFGTWKAGAILLSMSVLYGDEGIRHRLTDSQAKVLVTNAANADRIERSLVEHVLILDDELLAQRVDRVRDGRHRGRRPGPALLLLGHHRPGEGHPPRPPLHPRPRGVRLLPRRPRRRAVPRHGRVGVGSRDLPADRAVAAGRRAGGLPARGRLRPAQAARLPLPPRGHERVRHADGDPLDDVDRRRRHALSRRSSGSCARPASRSTRRRSAGSASSTGSRCSTTTGSPSPTRCAPTIPFMEVREGSMGKPMPGWDVAILDEDEQPGGGRRARGDLPAGALEPALPARLLEPARRRTPRRSFGGDWFHTKDAARTDEDGYFWYEGRADDVIISAGYRIGPFEVESACLEHSGGRRGGRGGLARRAPRQRGQGVRRARGRPRAQRRARATRSRRTSATTTPPTPIRGGSSSSPTCRRR